MYLCTYVFVTALPRRELTALSRRSVPRPPPLLWLGRSFFQLFILWEKTNSWNFAILTANSESTCQTYGDCA